MSIGDRLTQDSLSWSPAVLIATAFRQFTKPTLFWVKWLASAWIVYHAVGGLIDGEVLRYLGSGLATLPGFLAWTLPFAVTAGGIAWGDYCNDSGVRMLRPALVVGVAAGLVSLALAELVYSHTFQAYCLSTDSCGAVVRTSLLEKAGWASMAPINAVLGVLVAIVSGHKRPIMRMRVERWSAAVFVWVAGRLIRDAIVFGVVPPSTPELWASGAALVVPTIALLGLVWIADASAYRSRYDA